MVERIEISDDNLVEAIHGLKLLPEELHRVRRYAQLQAGKAARSLSKKSFRERTGIRTSRLARRRTAGSGARAWLGANAAPVKHIAGLVNVRRGKRTRSNSKTRITRKGKREAVQYVGDKIFIDNQYYPEFFQLNVPGKPIYTRVGKGRRGLEAVKKPIAKEVFQAADDVLPEVRQVLQDAFMRKATDQITMMGTKSFSAKKSRTEDRLSGIKFLRTNIR